MHNILNIKKLDQLLEDYEDQTREFTLIIDGDNLNLLEQERVKPYTDENSSMYYDYTQEEIVIPFTGHYFNLDFTYEERIEEIKNMVDEVNIDLESHDIAPIEVVIGD